MPHLSRLLAERRLRKASPSSAEIADLLSVVARDLDDAHIEALSVDRRFATAYNAALQLVTVVLRAEGFRTAGTGHHHTTIVCLPEILGEEHRGTADYLDACRAKRNTVDYDGVGVATASDVGELLRECESLRTVVLAWLGREHGDLRP